MCSTSLYSSKSCTHFFTNTFIFLLVLVLLVFVPSQPPHFVKDTIFTTLWELIYLFVVGIVVCYGLFSRKKGKVENVGYSNSDISASYGYVSSFFDNGVGNSCGYDEKNMTRVSGFGERFDFDEFKDARSSRLRNGVRDFDGVCEKNVGKDLNFRCFAGESMVFVGNGNYEVKPEAKNGYRPLNLPVRSLKSRIVDNGSDHGNAHLVDSDKVKKVKFRGLVPINLDDKFRETIVSSPIPWGSRSGSLDLKKNEDNGKPTFVGDSELVGPKVPTVKCFSPAVLTSEVEEFERKESLRVSFPPATRSSLATLTSKCSSSRSSSRRFSTGIVVEQNPENDLKEFCKGEAEDLLNRETKGVVSSNLDVKPATLVAARYISGSISEMTLKNNFKNDFKDLCKGQSEESMCKENKCIESSNLNVRHARLVEGQLQIGLTSEMNYEKSSANNLKGSDNSKKGDLLERENMSDDFWNLDLNTASLTTASSPEINGEKKSETTSMDFGNHKKEDSLAREKNGSIDSLKPGVKPNTTVKGLTRGKSVRTIRSNEISVEVKRSEEVYSSHIGYKFIKHCDEDEAGSLKKSDWRDGLKIEADEHSRKNRDKPSDTKKSNLRKNRNGERQKNCTSALVKPESIFTESENFQVIADEKEHRPGIVGDTQIESNEVDKKAAEFIAKFREQIRLQKVASKRESNFP